MSKYQPKQLTEEEVETLWQRAVEEHRQLNDMHKTGCALQVLADHGVAVGQLARDHGLRIAHAPMMTGIVRIQPIDAPTVKTYIGFEPTAEEHAEDRAELLASWGRWNQCQKNTT